MTGVDWSAFFATIVWPLVVVIVVLVFRRPIARITSDVASRTSKVVFPGGSVELQPLPQLTPTWDVAAGPASGDVRRLTSSELFDSYSYTLFAQLLEPKEADYAVVDLGSGEEWLTSRLYIFALVLGEVSHLKALVFLETAAGVRRRFLGVATPVDVRAALARKYPWLEQAFALSYADQFPKIGVDKKGESTLSADSYVLNVTNTGGVMQLVRKFIENIQRRSEPPQLEMGTYLSFQATDPGQNKSSTRWERGEWIGGAKLERDLGGCLEYSWYADSPDLSQRARIDGILRRPTRFVALVDEDRRFMSLVDRYELLSQRRGGMADNSDRSSA